MSMKYDQHAAQSGLDANKGWGFNQIEYGAHLLVTENANLSLSGEEVLIEKSEMSL